MDRKDAYYLGFLLGCAEHGLNPHEQIAKLEKTAGGAGDGYVENFVDNVMAIPRSAIFTGLLGGGTLGALSGVLSEQDILKMRRPPQLGELQRAELTAMYRQQAADLRSAAAALQRQKQRAAAIPRSPYGGV